MEQQEIEDRRGVEDKMRRQLRPEERRHMGVSNLRKFLEIELLNRYQKYLPSIASYVDQQTIQLVRPLV